MNHQPIITGRALGYRAVQVLGYVRDRVATDGIAPSYSMIAAALGINGRHKVSAIIARLEKRGLLSRVGGAKCPRTVQSRQVRRIMLKGNSARPRIKA